jgi:hypothetical protein
VVRVARKQIYGHQNLFTRLIKPAKDAMLSGNEELTARAYDAGF